jgi:hypothetical protein
MVDDLSLTLTFHLGNFDDNSFSEWCKVAGFSHESRADAILDLLALDRIGDARSQNKLLTALQRMLTLNEHYGYASFTLEKLKMTIDGTLTELSGDEIERAKDDTVRPRRNE